MLVGTGPCLVNAGGDLAGYGRPWPVGVETADGELTLELDRGALATSGRDRRRWKRDGGEAHHLIDPATGQAGRRRLPPRHRRREHGGRGGGAREGGLPRRARRPGRPSSSPRTAAPSSREAWREDRPDLLAARTRERPDRVRSCSPTSVLAGLTVKSKPLGRRVKAAAATDLHKFLSLLALGAIALHGLVLTLDQTVRMPLAALVVPGLSPYRPLATGIGVLAAELMALIYVSFSLRRRIGVRNWRRLHYLTFAVFGAATVHGLAAGTDRWAFGLYAGSVAAVTGLTAWRVVTKGGTRCTASRSTGRCVKAWRRA